MRIQSRLSSISYRSHSKFGYRKQILYLKTLLIHHKGLSVLEAAVSRSDSKEK